MGGSTEAEGTQNTEQWIRAWRGFSNLFWGLPLSVFLFFGAIEIVPLRPLPIPPYAIGAILVVVGVVRLWRARLPVATWPRDSRRALAAAALLLYFAPVVHWYSLMTRAGWHFLLNVAGLIAAMVWTVWTLNRLSGDAGAAVGDSVLAAESDLCGWLASALTLAPALVLAVLGSVLAVRYESSVATQIYVAHQRPDAWAPAFVLLPLTLTMISLWKAQARCMGVLARATAPLVDARCGPTPTTGHSR